MFDTDVVGDVTDADALEVVAELIVPVAVTRRVGIHGQPLLASLWKSTGKIMVIASQIKHV